MLGKAWWPCINQSLHRRDRSQGLRGRLGPDKHNFLPLLLRHGAAATTTWHTQCFSDQLTCRVCSYCQVWGDSGLPMNMPPQHPHANRALQVKRAQALPPPPPLPHPVKAQSSSEAPDVPGQRDKKRRNKLTEAEGVVSSAFNCNSAQLLLGPPSFPLSSFPLFSFLLYCPVQRPTTMPCMHWPLLLLTCASRPCCSCSRCGCPH